MTKRIQNFEYFFLKNQKKNIMSIETHAVCMDEKKYSLVKQRVRTHLESLKNMLVEKKMHILINNMHGAYKAMSKIFAKYPKLHLLALPILHDCEEHLSCLLAYENFHGDVKIQKIEQCHKNMLLLLKKVIPSSSISKQQCQEWIEVVENTDTKRAMMYFSIIHALKRCTYLQSEIDAVKTDVRAWMLQDSMTWPKQPAKKEHKYFKEIIVFQPWHTLLSSADSIFVDSDQPDVWISVKKVTFIFGCHSLELWFDDQPIKTASSITHSLNEQKAWPYRHLADGNPFMELLVPWDPKIIHFRTIFYTQKSKIWNFKKLTKSFHFKKFMHQLLMLFDPKESFVPLEIDD